jgi:V8-like Glu-specific endopeptidase
MGPRRHSLFRLVCGSAFSFLSLPHSAFSIGGQGESCRPGLPTSFTREFFSAARSLQSHTESRIGTPTQEAAIYGRDDRRPMNQQQFPYSAVGRLRYTLEDLDDQGRVIRTGESWCTATLVSECHILTARHCVEPQSPVLTGQCVVPRRRYTNIRFEDSRGRVLSTAAMHLGPSASPEDDFAFLLISKGRPGRELGHLGVLRKSSDQFSPGERFESLGFSADRDRGRRLTGDAQAATVRPSRDPRFLELRADTFGGASGGPIIRAADNRMPYIAGINTRAATRFDTESCRSEQVRLPDSESNALAIGLASDVFYDSLVRFMQEHSCN